MEQQCVFDCLNKRACDLLNCCIYRHELLLGKHELLKNHLGRNISTENLVKILEDLQPIKSYTLQKIQKAKNEAGIRSSPPRKRKKAKGKKSSHRSGIFKIPDNIVYDTRYPLFGHLKMPFGSTFPAGTPVYIRNGEELILIRGAYIIPNTRKSLQGMVIKLGHETKNGETVDFRHPNIQSIPDIVKPDIVKSESKTYPDKTWDKGEQQNFHYE